MQTKKQKRVMKVVGTVAIVMIVLSIVLPYLSLAVKI